MPCFILFITQKYISLLTNTDSYRSLQSWLITLMPSENLYCRYITKRCISYTQVPIFPGSQQTHTFDENRCFNIINQCISPDYRLKPDDIVSSYFLLIIFKTIKNIGFWNLSGVVAEKYFKDNVILCGDSAHSFPPAGGFGMNTGVQDAFNLAYRLSYLLKNNVTQQEEEKVLTQYSHERSSHARFNLSTAMRYYQNSLNIASHLGTNPLDLLIHRSEKGKFAYV